MKRDQGYNQAKLGDSEVKKARATLATALAFFLASLLLTATVDIQAQEKQVSKPSGAKMEIPRLCVNMSVRAQRHRMRCKAFADEPQFFVQTE